MTNNQQKILAALRRGPATGAKLAARTGLSRREVAGACDRLREQGEIGDWRPADRPTRVAVEILRSHPDLSTAEVAALLRKRLRRDVPTRSVYNLCRSLSNGVGALSSRRVDASRRSFYIPRLKTVLHRGNGAAWRKVKEVALAAEVHFGLDRQEDLPHEVKEKLIGLYRRALDDLAEKAETAEDREEVLAFKGALLKTLEGTSIASILKLVAIYPFYKKILRWGWKGQIFGLQEGDPVIPPGPHLHLPPAEAEPIGEEAREARRAEAHPEAA